MVHWALAVLRARRLALALFAALALTLAAAAGAQAAVTHSSITSPTDPFFGFDQGQTQNVTISGTSDGTTGDDVDILCYNDDGSTGTAHSTVASDVPVAADGTFTTSVPISDLVYTTVVYSTGYCRLRAVPSGTAPTSGLSAFAGPRALVGHLLQMIEDDRLFDYYAESPQLTATADFNSYGSCGLADSYLFDPTVTGQVDSTGFFCNDFPETVAASDPSRSGSGGRRASRLPARASGPHQSGRAGFSAADDQLDHAEPVKRRSDDRRDRPPRPVQRKPLPSEQRQLPVVHSERGTGAADDHADR